MGPSTLGGLTRKGKVAIQTQHQFVLGFVRTAQLHEHGGGVVSFAARTLFAASPFRHPERFHGRRETEIDVGLGDIKCTSKQLTRVVVVGSVEVHGHFSCTVNEPVV